MMSIPGIAMVIVSIIGMIINKGGDQTGFLFTLFLGYAAIKGGNSQKDE